jgi:putative holliday junction resolvase
VNVRVIALDYGSAKCGVAISDPTGILATPLDEVRDPATRKGMGKLLEMIRESEAERVVVGLPLSLRGGDSAQTREAREFARVLEKRLKGIPVEMYDERFTTRLAERDGGTRSSEDSRAAAHLLSSWLERNGNA